MNWVMFAEYCAVVVTVYFGCLIMWRFRTAELLRNTFEPVEVLVFAGAVAFLAIGV
jgi:hypothetical protein